MGKGREDLTEPRVGRRRVRAKLFAQIAKTKD
jgi:hypothetical protein